ncbi:hypothetical protein BJ170DRAFT_679086 [Xylariales sp. AK1849]|nr:hypothetical protein BJ170DRAFT_679086 [Xylariales sp. AK1849]
MRTTLVASLALFTAHPVLSEHAAQDRNFLSRDDDGYINSVYSPTDFDTSDTASFADRFTNAEAAAFGTEDERDGRGLRTGKDHRECDYRYSDDDYEGYFDSEGGGFHQRFEWRVNGDDRDVCHTDYNSELD